MFITMMLVLAAVIITVLALCYGFAKALTAVLFYYIVLKLGIKLYHELVD